MHNGDNGYRFIIGVKILEAIQRIIVLFAFKNRFIIVDCREFLIKSHNDIVSEIY